MSQKDLNILQRRWVELIKDFDYEIEYHLGMTNVVVDALSCKYKTISNDQKFGIRKSYLN